MSGIWWYLIGLATLPVALIVWTWGETVWEWWTERPGGWDVWVVYPDGEECLDRVAGVPRRKADERAESLRFVHVDNRNSYWGGRIVAVFTKPSPKQQEEA